MNWIWQHPDWPALHWDQAAVLPQARRAQQAIHQLLEKANLLNLDKDQALDTLLSNILHSSAIEGETLNTASVRSSLARRLQVSDPEQAPVSPRSEGLANMMMDAVSNTQDTVTLDRLFQWHHWLFPEGSTRLSQVKVGELRGNEPMQVVSGRIDKPRVHFEAPPRERLPGEMSHFLEWFAQSQNDGALDPLVRAGLCHFWFITLHPFDDGNGRIARALTDLALAQADQQSIRLFAISRTILTRRKSYYAILENSQKGTPEITPWLLWFMATVQETVQQVQADIEHTLLKARFWWQHQETTLNPEQRKVLNRLLEGGERGFADGISAAHYQKVAKVSKATATRHLSELVAKGCLVKLPGGGRSTRYQISEV